MRDRICVIASVASGAGVAVAVGEGRGVGVERSATVGVEVGVAKGCGVSGRTVGAGAAWDGTPQALNPISAAQHSASQSFHRSLGITAIILHFVEIFRL